MLCSQRLFLLKQLRDQAMAHGHLHTLFQAIVLNRIAHAIPAWGPFLNIAFSQRINGLYPNVSTLRSGIWYRNSVCNVRALYSAG